MATEVLLVKAGMTMTEGTVAEWYVADGEPVTAGQPLYRMETEKITLEVEAEADGIVQHMVPADSTCEPGTLIAYILAPGEGPRAATPQALQPGSSTSRAAATGAPSLLGRPDGDGRMAASPLARRLARELGVDLARVAGTGPAGRITEADVLKAEAVAEPPPAPAPGVPPAREVAASPLARRLADEEHIDLATVRGSGPAGRITKDDVDAAIAARKAAPRPAAQPAPATIAAGTRIPLRGMRKAIAERMHASLRDMAQLTMGMDVAMDEAVKLRSQLIEEWAADGIRPTYTDLVIRAVAKALRRHPGLNATVEEDHIELLAPIHVGVAVALDDGLVVPVIRDADDLSLREVAIESARLAQAARDGTLTLDELAGGTFAVTTLGMAGVDFFTPVINPPNVAIVGVGRIHDVVAWENERAVRRQAMTLSLTIDHRAVDGSPGAAFLNSVRELLEAPFRLLV